MDGFGSYHRVRRYAKDKGKAVPGTLPRLLAEITKVTPFKSRNGPDVFIQWLCRIRTNVLSPFAICSLVVTNSSPCSHQYPFAPLGSLSTPHSRHFTFRKKYTQAMEDHHHRNQSNHPSRAKISTLPPSQSPNKAPGRNGCSTTGRHTKAPPP